MRERERRRKKYIFSFRKTSASFYGRRAYSQQLHLISIATLCKPHSKLQNNLMLQFILTSSSWLQTQYASAIREPRDACHKGTHPDTFEKIRSQVADPRVTGLNSHCTRHCIPHTNSNRNRSCP